MTNGAGISSSPGSKRPSPRRPEWEPLDHGRRRIVVHHCPFQDIAADRPRVCGTFLATLIGELLGTDRVKHVPLRDRLRCCAIDIEEPVMA
jgi:predicted ArsR family transcriptional regulator